MRRLTSTPLEDTYQVSSNRLETGASIHVGDPDVDGPEVLELCLRSLPGFTSARYAKYFERNPLGPPAFVIARDPTGKAVGTAGLHPTEMLVDGQVRPAAVAGDFVVDEAFRGFGPAVALQRSLLSLCSQRGWAFAYGLPNPAASAVLKRVGYRELGEFVRLEQHLSPLARASARFKRQSKWDSKKVAFDMPPRFDELFDDVLAAMERPGITPHRTVENLNWLYELDQDGPSRFTISVARIDGRVAAYTVSHEQYGAWRIVELGWIDPGCLRTVLQSDLTRAAEAKLNRVDFLHLGAPNTLPDVVRDIGFKPVSSHRAVVFIPESQAGANELTHWNLFEGAIDL
jgi:GNAT superfamily N-acetyltransferase